MKLSQQTKLFIIFAILLIFLLGISNFLFLKQKPQPPLTPPTQPSPPTTSQPSTLPDTTVNWKTYKNEKYGFEFECPSWWVLEEDYHLKSHPQFIIRDKEKLSPNQCYDTTSITIMPRGYPAGELPSAADIKEEEVIFAGKRAHILYFLTTEGIVWGRYIKFLEYPVNWNEDGAILVFVKFLEPPERLCEGRNIEQLTEQEREICYWEKGYQWKGNIDKEDSKILEQILSTFKFIDTKDTTNWKTYRNEKYGFEFEYPKIYDEEKEYQLCRISESKDKNFITLAGRIQISVLDSNGLNLNEYIDTLIEEGRLQIETKAVEGDKATITYRIQDSLAYGIINFYINKLKNDGKIYMIALERPFNLCDYNQTSIWDVYDKVVSSFRFIEPAKLNK